MKTEWRRLNEVNMKKIVYFIIFLVLIFFLGQAWAGVNTSSAMGSTPAILVLPAATHSSAADFTVPANAAVGFSGTLFEVILRLVEV